MLSYLSMFRRKRVVHPIPKNSTEAVATVGVLGMMEDMGFLDFGQDVLSAWSMNNIVNKVIGDESREKSCNQSEKII